MFEKHFWRPFLLLAWSITLAAALGTTTTTNLTEISVGDPPRMRLRQNMSYQSGNKVVFYTTVQFRFIPAYNFYPCLVQGLVDVANTIPPTPWIQPWTCERENVRWSITPQGPNVEVHSLADALRLLMLTFLDYEVPNVEFDYRDNSASQVVTAKGSVKYGDRGEENAMED